jgi:hypothetical protein
LILPETKPVTRPCEFLRPLPDSFPSKYQGAGGNL